MTEPEGVVPVGPAQMTRIIARLDLRLGKLEQEVAQLKRQLAERPEPAN